LGRRSEENPRPSATYGTPRRIVVGNEGTWEEKRSTSPSGGRRLRRAYETSTSQKINSYEKGRPSSQKGTKGRELSTFLDIELTSEPGDLSRRSQREGKKVQQTSKGKANVSSGINKGRGKGEGSAMPARTDSTSTWTEKEKLRTHDTLVDWQREKKDAHGQVHGIKVFSGKRPKHPKHRAAKRKEKEEEKKLRRRKKKKD